ncbi:HypC/HybG/HupF family hydrogenase formation chaperone [Bacillota bacterium LX-D]|nr:HypC/HybG/HupF family hydrogenase formation chaperone [Bacillota bacterium LX-D]
MCVAIPGKVLELSGKVGKVDFNGNIINVDVSLVKAQVGDYVLVHAGCAIEVMKEEQAKEILSIFKELEEVTRA